MNCLESGFTEADASDFQTWPEVLCCRIWDCRSRDGQFVFDLVYFIQGNHCSDEDDQGNGDDDDGEGAVMV